MPPSDSAVTRSDIDALLAFLPGFEEPGRAFVVAWRGAWPQYAPDVEDFFRLAGSAPWTDFGYRPDDAGRMLADDALLAEATLDDIRAMLTFCVRGERFADGHRARLLETGCVQALLRRLAVLRATVS